VGNNKKKKKGFTLIELLAVIVILAVIILLATNVIIPLLNKARKKSLLDEAHVYQNAAQNYHAFDIDSNDQTASCISIEDLNGEYVKKSSDKYKGVVKTEFINNEFVQTINLTDGKYYVVGTGSLSLSNVKTNKPSGFTISCGDFNPVLAGDTNENSLAYKLLMNEGGTTLDDNLDIINARVANFNNGEDNPANSGIYKAVDDDGATYYYRGNVSNNWVEFAGFYWRVIRINGDGSIRLIYSGAKNSSHTGTAAAIMNTTYGDTTINSATTNDAAGDVNPVTTNYANGTYGNTYVGYMYNPAKVVSTYPDRIPNSVLTLNSFFTFTNIGENTEYYFFENFDKNVNCDKGNDNDESGFCTIICREEGVDCVKSTLQNLALDSNNYSTTDAGVYPATNPTQYVYKNKYKYTCWGYGTAVKKNNSSDGTTSVYVSCPIVSEIIGTIKNSKNSVKVKLHGLFSESEDLANQNIKDSNIKKRIDTWYENNILGQKDSNDNYLENYLTDSTFCNNRVALSSEFPLESSIGGSYSYIGYNEIYLHQPSYICNNRNRDAFSMGTSSQSLVQGKHKGNSMLKYPVGLITASEVAFAGKSSGKNNTNMYLNIGARFWTMSPLFFHSGSIYGYIWSVSDTGFATTPTGGGQYVRPVINLSKDVLYSSGTGIESDPYQITI